MVTLGSLALVGSLPRDGVSIKILVVVAPGTESEGFLPGRYPVGKQREPGRHPVTVRRK